MATATRVAATKRAMAMKRAVVTVTRVVGNEEGKGGKGDGKGDGNGNESGGQGRG